MFGMGGGFGGGPSSVQSNAAAGLPHADLPGELRDRVAALVEDEPEHPTPEIEWSAAAWDRRPFTLWRFLRPHRTRLLGAVALVTVETIALQLGPVLTQIGIDDGVLAGDAGVLTTVGIVYIIAVVAAIGLGATRVAYTGRLGERLMEQLRIRVFAHLQRQGVDYFTDERAGVVLTRMTSDIEALSVLFQEGVVNLLVQGLTLTVITVLLFSYDPLLATITLLVAVPPTLVVSLWFRSNSATGYRRVRDRIADLLADLQESLAGIRVIAAFDRRERSVHRHRDAVGEHLDANLTTSRLNSTYAPATELIGIVTQGIVLGTGAWMVTEGRITVGELAAFLLFLTSFFAPIQALVQLYNTYQQGGAAILKLRDLLSTEPTVAEAADAAVLPPIDGELSLERVTFGYTTDRPVLDDVTLQIDAGETIALVGETGAGKSTVAKLLMRFYDPTDGRVLVDGIDLTTVSLHSLRSQLGVVPQEPFLFAGTVRDNVGFARPGADSAELTAALDAVGITDLVERIGGLDAVVHERGASLSAGERQLLALARAFVARPRVLILDEATSNLDLQSEARIERALDVVLDGRTAVIIAHRLATARRADRIGVVHDGRIVELGSHQELVEAGGRYADLHASWVAHGGAA